MSVTKSICVKETLTVGEGIFYVTIKLTKFPVSHTSNSNNDKTRQHNIVVLTCLIIVII